MAHQAPLHLSDEDVLSLALGPADVRPAVEAAFRAHANGELRCEPKTSIAIAPGHAFQSLAAVDTARGLAALKWVGMVPPGGAADVNINASILLSDVASGKLLCLMDARRATALRTAAMTAVAAQYLARRDSAAIGFIGAGVQAQSHLEALAGVLPALSRVRVASGSGASAESFAARCRESGFDARATDAREAVAESDVVVSTVPIRPGFAPFLDAAWVKPGAFVAAVDLGRSWKHDGLDSADLTAVDDAAMRHYAKPGNLIPSLEHAHATLSDLAGGRHAGRSRPEDRIFFFSSGSGIGDVAIAMLIHERARAFGIGRSLA